MGGCFVGGCFVSLARVKIKHEWRAQRSHIQYGALVFWGVFHIVSPIVGTQVRSAWRSRCQLTPQYNLEWRNIWIRDVVSS